MPRPPSYHWNQAVRKKQQKNAENIVQCENKQRVLEEITGTETERKPLLMLLGNALAFRALYKLNADTEDLSKTVDIGPKVVNVTMVERFFK